MGKNYVKIYLKCSKPSKLKSNNIINRHFKGFGDYPIEESTGIQNWNSLVKFIINPNGEFISFEIISPKNEIFDAHTTSFLSSISPKILFKKAKHDKKNVHQEVIVPIVYSVNGFKRNKNPYNWYYWQMMPNYYPHTRIPIINFTPR